MSARIAKAIAWARARLVDCDRTQREARVRQQRDWAYGESVAIKAMVGILEGEGEGEGESLIRYIDDAKRAAGDERVSGEPLADFIRRILRDLEARVGTIAEQTKLIEKLESDLKQALDLMTPDQREEWRRLP